MTVRLVCVFVVLVCMALSSVLAVQISASAGRHQLVYQTTVEEADPTEVSVGIAMGAFRGLFVNMLWMRANELKEAGKYHEAVDLASTITKLQPRFPRVWSFHAWNLAYNISVVTQTPPERWYWVRSGVDLLRSEGIPKNPNNMHLHKELAWIFLHKIQGYLDDAAQYYKRQHAAEWAVVVGKPPVRTTELADRDVYIQALVAQLDEIATAHDTLDELYADEPMARELVEELDKIGLQPDLRFIYEVERLGSAITIASQLEGVEATRNALLGLMANPDYA